MTATALTAGEPRDLTSLIDFALDSLPAMRLEDGVFCFERRVGKHAPVGRSPRYTLMVELGLLRAQAAGYAVPFDLEELDAVASRELEAGELTPGDIGLMLWIDARRADGCGAELADRLDGALAANGGLGARLGMELGWIVTGLAHHVAAGGSPTGDRLLYEALDQLLVDNRAPSALFRHFGDAGWRRRFPNFATQIYSVLALAVVARNGLDDRALPAAIATADRLLEMQLPDGGWPWLFDAERGTVAERYEIYSVHQDAMAPMALLELWEVCREPRFTDAVARGLVWIYGGNELGMDMVDRANGLVLRSIRRKRGHDRIWAGAKTAASLAGLSTQGATARMTETNPTDRPYHFGWVLEAWCGREGVLSHEPAIEASVS
jgi:hypothetical protein